VIFVSFFFKKYLFSVKVRETLVCNVLFWFLSVISSGPLGEQFMMVRFVSFVFVFLVLTLSFW
jgi:hypothetical protein